MMAGNPSNWWNMFPPNSLSPQFVLGSSSLPLSTSMDDDHHQYQHQQHQQPNSQSWSQLLLGGLQEGDEDGLVLNSDNNHFQVKKLENLEERVLIPFPRFGVGGDDHQDHDDDDHHHDILKQETCSQNSKSLSFLWNDQKESSSSSISSIKASQIRPITTSSSPKSSINNTNCLLEFSFNKVDSSKNQHNYSSECATSPTATGGVCKKPRVQPVSGQPPIKNHVRKEKVGDRITALHQLVSPFGKTDTASVLSEAIGYVRFLHCQIEALISPYLGNNSSNPTKKDQQLLLNDSSLKRKLPSSQENEEEDAKDLRSRGLCLVPISCTQHVQSDINGADYWAQAYNGSF